MRPASSSSRRLSRKIECGSRRRDVHDDDVVALAALEVHRALVADREQVAEHPDHRGDAGAGGDEEELAALGGQHELAGRLLEVDQRAGPGAVHQVVADLAVRHGLDRDRDAAVARGGRGSASRRATGGRRRRRCRCGRTGRARGRPSRRRGGSRWWPRRRSRGGPPRSGPAASAPERSGCDQVEVVGGQQRRGRRLGEADQAVTQTRAQVAGLRAGDGRRSCRRSWVTSLLVRLRQIHDREA